ncbi:MAG: helix-turn-helix domain-containing protein [Acidobacteria bacterium]|nr:helix-turn-helix domain-containing protein [Acidobacteriota bacterium]
MPNRKFTPSSGNVFADLNLPHADDLLAKAELATKIIAEIQRRRLTQSQAAEILGIDQPKVSALKQGKLSGFSCSSNFVAPWRARGQRSEHHCAENCSSYRSIGENKPKLLISKLSVRD